MLYQTDLVCTKAFQGENMTMNLTSMFNDVYNFGIVQSNASPAFFQARGSNEESTLSNKGTPLPLDA